jgi:uncharacterized LabA/DUF88 family protein
MTSILTTAATIRTAIHPQERTALFIDGRELYGATHQLGYDVEDPRWLELFRQHGRPTQAWYFMPTGSGSGRDQILRPFADWLAYHDYTIVPAPARRFMTAGRPDRERAVEIAVCMLRSVAHYDHGVLFSGASVYTPVIERLKRDGKRMTIVSTTRTMPPILSDELRRQADHFIELADVLTVAAAGYGLNRLS